MELKYKPLTPYGLPPKRSSEYAGGVDLQVPDDTHIELGVGEEIGLDFEIAVEIPEGHVGLLIPRSSWGSRGVELLNTVGVIDSDYRGPVIAKIRNNGKEALEFKTGDRVVQLVIVASPLLEVVECKHLSATKRGSGGFGSTDKKA